MQRDLQLSFRNVPPRVSPETDRFSRCLTDFGEVVPRIFVKISRAERRFVFLEIYRSQIYREFNDHEYD